MEVVSPVGGGRLDQIIFRMDVFDVLFQHLDVGLKILLTLSRAGFRAFDRLRKEGRVDWKSGYQAEAVPFDCLSLCGVGSGCGIMFATYLLLRIKGNCSPSPTCDFI